MKKLLSFLLVAATLLTFAACGMFTQEQDTSKPESSEQTSATTTNNPTTAATTIDSTAAEASRQKYGDWRELKFVLSGAELQLPFTYGEFKEKTGFQFSVKTENFVILRKEIGGSASRPATALEIDKSFNFENEPPDEAVVQGIAFDCDLSFAFPFSIVGLPEMGNEKFSWTNKAIRG